MWQCRRGSLLPRLIVIANLLLVLCTHFFCHVGDCRSPTRSDSSQRSLLLSSDESDDDERLQDFLEWVARVGSKNAAKIDDSNVGKSLSVSEEAAGGLITVGQSGGAQFTSVQDAVDAVPSGNNQRVVIQISAGLYEEKVNVPSSKPYITFQGAGASLTTISWHDTAFSSGGTPNSASVAIDSDNFNASGITFKNSAPAPPIGSTNKQAVALRISGDQAAFYNCNFLGSQDTLFDDVGKHYFENCFIQGSVDFICGDGQSLYKGCELHALQRSTESLTAQRRSSPSEDTGYSFVDCNVTGVGMAYLGRAWGPYSRVVFSFTSMDNIVRPEGWYNWGDSSRDNTVFFGQYKCTGPGAVESKRVGWSHELSDEQAAPFQSLSFIDGASWVQS